MIVEPEKAITKLWQANKVHLFRVEIKVRQMQINQFGNSAMRFAFRVEIGNLFLMAGIATGPRHSKASRPCRFSRQKLKLNIPKGPGPHFLRRAGRRNEREPFRESQRSAPSQLTFAPFHIQMENSNDTELKGGYLRYASV